MINATRQQITPVALLLTALSIVAQPTASAQTYGYSYGHGNSVQVGTPFGGGSAFGSGTSFGSGSNSGYVGPTGSYYYPGFGWSSRPLGTQPLYGTTNQVYGGSFYGAPIYQAPVAVTGSSGFFRIGNLQAQFWQAPSGYYYPWGIGAIGAAAPVYYVNQGVTQPSRPALSSVFSDMEKYLDYSKDRLRVSSVDYTHLFRRLHDLQAKYDNLLAHAGGALDPADEDNIRRDVDQLSGEIAMRIKPGATK